MGETLTQRRRVGEEVFRDVKPCPTGKKKMTVPVEKAPTNHVPAVAIKREVQALSSIIGRKGRPGG